MYKDDLAYYAGFFDGEGSIMITHRTKKHYHTLEIRITNTNYQVLKQFEDCFGGGVYKGSVINWRYKPRWQWCISASKALAFLKLIYPYLRLKKKEAETAIEFQEGRKQGEQSVEKHRKEHFQYLRMKELKHAI